MQHARLSALNAEDGASGAEGADGEEAELREMRHPRDVCGMRVYKTGLPVPYISLLRSSVEELRCSK